MNDYISDSNVPEPPFDFNDFCHMATGCWWMMGTLLMNSLSFLGGFGCVKICASISVPLYILAWCYMMTCPSWVMPLTHTRLILGPALFFAGWWLKTEELGTMSDVFSPIFMGLAFLTFFLFFYELGRTLRSIVVIRASQLGLFFCTLLFFSLLLSCAFEAIVATLMGIRFLAFLAITTVVCIETLLLFVIVNIYTYK